MGHLFLDAYHATGDEYYYQAAQQVADALMLGQLSCGGWNYVIDFAGDKSLREWYNTVGKNAWRLEEFQHYYGNATFDDQVTSEVAKFLLRIYVEKHDLIYKSALDKVIQLVLSSQYSVGAWPQRFPLMYEFSHSGNPDYTSFLTFNDGVTEENIDFLILCYQVFGEERFLDPIRRGMNSFLVTQLEQPQPGWALQYTTDLKPAGARTYEPKALSTHTTAGNIEQLLKFYYLTGEKKYLVRIPEALNWLESCRIPKEWKTVGKIHPTFIELNTNKPLFLHRKGSNVFNGHYYVDYDRNNTIGHYSSFRFIDMDGLRARYKQAISTSPEEVVKGSPLQPGNRITKLPRMFIARELSRRHPITNKNLTEQVDPIIHELNSTGYWPVELMQISHPYLHDGSTEQMPGDYSQTYVGDETDTSPFKSEQPIFGISIMEYIKNMNVLIRYLEDKN
jgi:PelA/Pel-15E family pectate lyase